MKACGRNSYPYLLRKAQREKGHGVPMQWADGLCLVPMTTLPSIAQKPRHGVTMSGNTD